MTMDIYKHVKKSGGRGYVELPTKQASIINIQNRIDKKYGTWCIIAGLHPGRTNALKTKRFKKCFDTLETTGTNLQSRLRVKNSQSRNSKKIEVNFTF